MVDQLAGLEGKRRLAAIMFTDVVGFTALAQENESLALQVLDQQRKVLRPIFKLYSGVEVKTVGDAFLVEFESALDATRCAIEVQRRLAELGESNHLPKVRIGIHLGDVVHAESDVYGDAVNLASRMQSAAEPGGICISQQVYDQVKNKLDCGFEKVEGIAFKNVKEPVAVYRLAPGSCRGEPGRDARRIAILPLANFSPNPGDGYLADALTDELITSLSGVRDLHVIARTSVMQFKDSKKSVADISKTLGVGSVLQGSVLKSGDRIRINLQLVDSGSEEHLWANKYDRKFEDIFAIQDDVAKSVTESLRVKLTPVSELPKTTEVMDAYTHCLRGRMHLYDRTEAALRDSAREFELAIEADPGYARAAAGLADATYLLGYYSYVPVDAAYEKANRLALKAIELDPNLAEPHATLGVILDHRDYEHRRAEEEFKRAISLNPNYPLAHHWYAVMLASLGRLEEAIEQLSLAQEADPLSLQVSVLKGLALAWAGRRQEAEREWDAVEKRSRGFYILYFQRAFCRIDCGELDLARSDYEMLAKLLSDQAFALFVDGACKALAGDRVGSMRVIGEFKRQTDVGGYADMVATLYAMNGDLDGYFEWANRAVDSRHIEIASSRYMNWARGARADPRYAQLLGRMNLSP